MRFLIMTPIDQTLANIWGGVNVMYKKAFLILLGINFLAFGFEMTNLTIHHDDVGQMLIQNDQLQMFLGRFGMGWFYYYTQGAYIMPFLQMFQGVVAMSLYGITIAYLWGVRRTIDIILIAGIVCVFPFMAQIFQYNTAMAAYPLAHFFVALAVLFSLRATFLSIVIGALFYMVAFSIYQSVASNAATIFLFWILGQILYESKRMDNLWISLKKPFGAAIIAVALGGGLYIFVILLLNIKFDDSYQSVDQAFKINGGVDLKFAFEQVITGTRSFYFWPEHYFPNYLKKMQLLLLFGAGIVCVWLPNGYARKMGAVLLLGLAVLAPRSLQLLHPQGWFHNLTLTAYAVVIAGVAMIILRAGQVALRNGVIILVLVLMGGYIVNCNWISTVNYLNTQAHYMTATQILTRARALPSSGWDGKKIVVVGSYHLRDDFPYKHATGVASSYIDAGHMQALTLLMRDDAIFVPAEKVPAALEYAETHPAWPHPSSVGVVDGMGVVVLSKPSGGQ